MKNPVNMTEMITQQAFFVSHISKALADECAKQGKESI
jgi:hypothetical protein